MATRSQPSARNRDGESGPGHSSADGLGDGGPVPHAMRQAVLNAAIWKRIQRWLERDAAQRRTEQAVWRAAWVFMLIAIAAAVAYGFFHLGYF